MRSAIVEIQNTFHVIDPSYSECDAVDSADEKCSVWSWRRPWRPSGWTLLDTTHVDSGATALLGVLHDLLNDRAVVLRGPMRSISSVLERICRVLESVDLPVEEKREVFSHCLIRLERGEPVDVSVDAPCSFRPGIYGRMAAASNERPAYVPAHLVWSLHATVAESNDFAPIGWSRQRFSDVTFDYVEPVFGLPLEIRPLVFIPVPVVMDLLAAAYLSPGSPLPADLQRGTVLEPCTGSGVLGITAALLGAPNVVSSDIDPTSAELARFNAGRTGFANVTVELLDGLSHRDDASMLLVNPPWGDRSEKGLEHFRRCFTDPGRRLLRRLLEQARSAGVRVAYVFSGSEDPFEPLRIHFLPLARFDRWVVDRTWESSHTLRLHRLVI